MFPTQDIPRNPPRPRPLVQPWRCSLPPAPPVRSRKRLPRQALFLKSWGIPGCPSHHGCFKSILKYTEIHDLDDLRWSPRLRKPPYDPFASVVCSGVISVISPLRAISLVAQPSHVPFVGATKIRQI